MTKQKDTLIINSAISLPLPPNIYEFDNKIGDLCLELNHKN